MKQKIVTILPFITIPFFIPIYMILDNLILVEVFGCGCVPATQTNLLHIPFNANDLRMTVFTILTISLSVWSIGIAKRFDQKIASLLYCSAVLVLNVILTLWVIKTFMWA